jgi:hypothetical protein
MPIWTWLRENQPPISAVSNFFRMFSTCVAAGALWFAASQFSQASRSLQSATVYNIQKDGPELLSSMRKDNPDVYQYIL